MHIDHIGGLANLMMAIRKVTKRTGVPHINDNSYDVYVPDLDKLQAVKCIADVPREPKGDGVAMYEHLVEDGLVFADENLCVTALHNRHLRESGENGWHSYSYLIEGQGRRIVFSGDVRSPQELDALIGDGCDLLIMETGHHKVADVCDYVAARPIAKLVLTHHGREILGDPDAARRLIAERGIPGRVLDDGDTVEL
jgi:ribonuclease BN (tRNA processing enzyme)